MSEFLLLVFFCFQEGHTALYLAEIKQNLILITILRKITKVIINKEVNPNRGQYADFYLASVQILYESLLLNLCNFPSVCLNTLKTCVTLLAVGK